MKALQHLKTINHHKWLVCQGCFKVGLYKQGLLHDLSKYSPTEFLVGCKFYQGTRSPNNAEREVKGYSAAWLHHKGRNRHHYEYWLDYSTDLNEGIIGMKMPVRGYCKRSLPWYVFARIKPARIACSVGQQRGNYHGSSRN